MDLQYTIDRQVHAYAVSRAISCKVTGQLLDERDSVTVLVSDADGEAAGEYVVTAEAWDQMKETTTAHVGAHGGTLEIFDGRELYVLEEVSA